MAFASRADLLARSNARRLANLAVPADMDMVPDEALRAAIAGSDLDIFTPADQAALALALEAIDKALADADALILSYGIPNTIQTTLLARLASTVALYYLQGAERMTDDVRKAYDGVIDTLKAHSRGDLDLVPAAPTDPAPSGDLVIISSRPGRYGVADIDDEVWP
ncbi:phage protein Gp36 family protein [Azospira sp. APE16]|uniref:phage protein Gp36 family protein n=1 Tax=Azospira sp. APE16 TaxID=3394231 RepID=UPI003A4D3CF3